MFDGDDVALVLPDVRQRPDAGDVADRPQAVGRAQARVDRDAREGRPRCRPSRGRCRRRAGGGRSRRGGGRRAARGRRRARGRSRRRRVARRVACAPSTSSMPSRRRTSPSASPSGAGSRGSTCSAAFDERHLAAEAAHGLRELDADRTAAEHEQAPRDRLHAGRLAVRPHAVELAQARDRRHERVGAVGDDDVLGGVARRRRPRPRRGPRAGRVPRSRSMPLSVSQRSCPASE